MKRCPSCASACQDTHRHCPACGSDLSKVEAQTGDVYIGTTLANKYKITELIGAGAMGKVYRAHHLSLDAQVAVKLLNPDVATDAQTARRFQTEARAASRLRHPNTIQILDFGQAASGELFLVMEYLRGRTLAKILEEEGRLTPRRIADLLGQALSALDEAHAAGVVHRDFKPENVFVETLRTGKEHVKVLDFGIAKLRGEADANLTSRGVVCGTPEYMSPEQIRGEELDARSDVYAAGVVLYEMLCGVRPFETHGPLIEVLQAHLNTPPIPPHERVPDPNMPRPLEEVCLRALAKSQQLRFRSAAELKTAIEGAVRGLSGEHCKQCGMPVGGTARFCPECGAVLRPSGGSGVAAMPPTKTDGSDGAEAAAVELPLPLPLVGRDSVLERLEALDREALLMVGGPGIGKSAVVEAWRKREEARFRNVVVVGPDPSGAVAPWHPVRSALGQVLGCGDHPTLEELDRAVGEHRADRTGLAELFGCAGRSSLPLDMRRRECAAAALALLRRTSATFVFEDCDQHDRPSRQLLSRLIDQPGQATVLATAAHAEAIDVELEVVRLPPLDAHALDELAQRGLPPGVGELSGGVPLSIDQWVRARGEGARDSTAAGRLEVLSPDARALLTALAVAGRMSLARAEQVTGFTDPGPAVRELAAHGWLGGETGALEVASPTLRRRVYDAIAEEQRRELHARLVAAMATGSDPIVVAHHAYQSGDFAAAPVLERAGDAARDLFDDEAAVRWYRAALERGRQALAAGVGEEARQIRIALKLGVVLRYRGDVIQSEHVLRDALELANARNDKWAIVEARRALARLAATWHQHERAHDHLVAAVQAALALGDQLRLCELYLEIADVLRDAGDDEAAQSELWEGLMLVTGGDGPEATDGPELLWRMVLLLAEAAQRRGRLDEAFDLGNHALRHARRIDSTLARARAHALLGLVEERRGRLQRAADERHAAVEELRKLGDRHATVEALIALAAAHANDRGAAEGWVKEAEELADQLGWSEGVSRSRAALAQLR